MIGKRASQLPGENHLIDLIRKSCRRAGSSPVEKGIGDDAAVLRPAGQGEFRLVTTDMLLEGIDFRREWITPECLGRKSLAVNLSDLAAMGARPLFYTVSLALPKDITQSWVMKFYKGLAREADPSGAALIGGDLSSSKSEVMVSITAIGESVNRKVLYRSGGKSGDVLYVTGVLGKSAAGLRLLQNGMKRSGPLRREALIAHLQPEPRCEAGLWLAQSGLVSCMMDISDGLSSDLPRICAASGVGAEIRAVDLPVYSESASWGCDPVDLALSGGEDFELLFAVPESNCTALEASYPRHLPQVTKIGHLTGAKGQIRLLGPDMKWRRLKALGFDHFA